MLDITFEDTDEVLLAGWDNYGLTGGVDFGAKERCDLGITHVEDVHDGVEARGLETEDIVDEDLTLKVGFFKTVMERISAPGPTPEEATLAASERAEIDRCLSELESPRAEAVRLTYLEGYAYKDVAARFDLPLNTVRTWLRRSLQSLKTCLSA